ncbi:uncharacterized protein LOC129766124 [Toxorhynchites rutilus septentrionalis]|uniref:uncharacterized protein LOC129766124 n=1 Tax=Toxorhynchites rutilus septentrionalis TaxID=329112 RepID=UPI002479AF1D|nr:uncharacterized protein LOC129766124 [Toxorhynchites rutilus septentrionalis]
MKFVILFCVVLVHSEAFTLHQRQQGDVYALQCLAETGVNPASVALLKIGDFSLDDQRSKCFVRCFFEKEGFIDGEGKLQTDNIVEALSADFEREKVEAVILKCAVDGKDACETAFQAYECFYKNRETLFVPCTLCTARQEKLPYLERKPSLLELFSMRFVGAYACCLLIAMAAVDALPKKGEIRKSIRSCVKETGVSGKSAVRVLKGNFSDDSDDIKCFVKCMFNRLGLIDDEDEILQDVIREKALETMDESEADKLFKKCHIVGDDICDTAFKIYKCFLENHDVPADMLDF